MTSSAVSLTKIQAAVLVIIIHFSPYAWAVELTLEVPNPGEFILDLSDLLDQEAKAKINATCKSLQQEQETQIIVITIDSATEYGGKSSNITSFSTQFIGKLHLAHNQNGDKTERGKIILFMIAKDEQKAHIVFGGNGWKVKDDRLRRQILDELVNPQIQQADYVAGIFRGIEELDNLSRGQSVSTGWQWPWRLIAIALGVIFVLSHIVKRNRSDRSYSETPVVLKPRMISEDEKAMNKYVAALHPDDAEPPTSEEILVDDALENMQLHQGDKSHREPGSPYGELIPINNKGEEELLKDPILLEKKDLLLGRHPSCDRVLPRSGVSRFHCELNLNEGRWHIRDLDSLHGIKINGFKVKAACLVPGSILTIGNYDFYVNYSPASVLAAKQASKSDDTSASDIMKRVN